jgi:hypothetical protein
VVGVDGAEHLAEAAALVLDPGRGPGGRQDDRRRFRIERQQRPRRAAAEADSGKDDESAEDRGYGDAPGGTRPPGPAPGRQGA